MYLNDNAITKIPTAIGNLAKLRVCVLSVIGALTSTQQGLFLQSNQITEVPEEINNLSALQILYLQNNQLRTLPFSIATLPAILRLDVSNNPLDAPLDTLVTGQHQDIRVVKAMLREMARGMTPCVQGR